MTSKPNPQGSPITQQAAELVAEVERTLADGERRLRELGLDPAKVRAFGGRPSPDLQRRIDEALAADLRDVERDVAQARASLQGAAAAAPAARPRSGRGFV